MCAAVTDKEQRIERPVGRKGREMAMVMAMTAHIAAQQATAAIAKPSSERQYGRGNSANLRKSKSTINRLKHRVS